VASEFAVSLVSAALPASVCAAGVVAAFADAAGAVDEPQAVNVPASTISAIATLTVFLISFLLTDIILRHFLISLCFNTLSW
jgi:hypothetical protein